MLPQKGLSKQIQGLLPSWFNKWKPNDKTFDIAFGGFLFFGGIWVAVISSGARGAGVNVFVALTVIFGFLTIIIAVRMQSYPKSESIATKGDIDSLRQAINGTTTAIVDLTKEVHDGFANQQKTQRRSKIGNY